MQRALVTSIAISILAACGDPTGSMPPRFEARYAAGSVGQTPLPVTAQFPESERTLLADTLVFTRDGIAQRTIVVRLREFIGSFRTIQFVSKISYTYRINGRSLELEPVCQAGNPCSEAVSGEIDEEQLTVPSNLLGLDYGRLFMNRLP